MQVRRAFTLFDLAGLVLIAGCVIPAAAVVLGHQPGGERDAERQRKDATQIRGIHQGMVTWAQNNGDVYPLPSKIDKLDCTLKAEAESKDTTANIYSLMIFNGTVSTEIFVSPVEVNKNIEVYDRYEFDQPTKAFKPERALWDPKFSGDFSGDKKGGASYAHLVPNGERLKRWSNTFISSERVLSMRGPEVSKAAHNEDGSVTVTLANPKSNTIGMYEASTSWSGNTAFNDNHVEFVKRALSNGKVIAPDPKGANYTDEAGKVWPDIFCFDEPDDAKGTNEFLGIFIKAGTKRSDFKAIWD